MRILFSFVVLAFIVLIGVMQLRFNKLNELEESSRGELPLDELGGFIDSMIKSSNEPVFLNVGDLGKDSNYCVFEKIEGGVVLNFPVGEGGFMASDRQSAYVAQLESATMELALPISKETEMNSDGSLRSTIYRVEIVGDPAHVSGVAGNVLQRTFGVSDLVPCSFRYHNMPGPCVSVAGEEPRKVTKDEFLKTRAGGEYVYMGEQESEIYLIPKESATQRPVSMDSKILVSDIRELTSEELAMVRGNHGESPVTD